MSVIGPRPGLWNQDILTAERDKYNANDVKPGLTGWAQINGRDEIEISEKAKKDRINNWIVRLYDQYILLTEQMNDYIIANITHKQKCMHMIYELLSELQPDGYLVLGDTNSCLSAISAKRLHIPLFQTLGSDPMKKLDVQDQVIPDNVVLHGLKQRNGKFIVRIFGVNDNPKENRLFGRDLDELEDTLGVRFWEENGQAHTLWSAALYQEADTIREATDAALELYEIVTGGKDFDRSLWTAASHKSLCAGFNEADPDAIIAWNKRMADLVTMDGIAKAIRDQVPAGSIRKLQSLTKIQKEWLRKRLRKADFGEKMRLHYYLGVILEDENEVQECFRIIQSEVLEATIKSLAYNEQARIVTDHHTVRLPLRVNWGGGWSDTPPYCNEKGGTVLNAAILLNGEKPVEVTLERIPEQKVVFDSA